VIRAIFFDGGGVISHFDDELISTFENEHGLRPGDILKVLYSGNEWADAENGLIEEDAWLQIGADRLAASSTPVAFDDLRGVWEMAFLKLDILVLRLAETLSASYRIGLLTNSSSSQERVEEKLARAGILDLWHVVVCSANEGVAKPDERIYAIAAEKIGVPPSECVHIDDKPENVLGARQAGFKAIHHIGSYHALVEALADIGVSAAGAERRSPGMGRRPPPGTD
jgi:putative hydrolase of the HAD superfamily